MIAAKKEHARLLKDAKTPGEIFGRIESFFEDHPDWVNRTTRPEDKQRLVAELLKTAQSTAGEKAMRMSIEADLVPTPYAVSHADAFMEIVKELSPQELANRSRLLGLLQNEELAGGAKLLSDLIVRAESRENIHSLMYALAHRSDGQTELIVLLSDSRPYVVTKAASLLSSFFYNEQSRAAVEQAIKKSESRQRAGEDRTLQPGGTAEADSLRFHLGTMKERIGAAKK